MKRVLSLLVVTTLLVGCDGVYQLFDWLQIIPNQKETGSAQLEPFASKSELDDYIKSELTRRGSVVADPFNRLDFAEETAGIADADDAAPPSAGGPQADGSGQATEGNSFSQTTIQETGVDEADVVKTDGTYIYLINDQTLRIAHAYPADQLSKAATVDLEGYGREIYLNDGLVIALTETFGQYWYGIEPVALEVDAQPDDSEAQSTEVSSGEGAPPEEIAVDSDFAPQEYQYQRPKTIVTVIDVSQPSAPSVVSVSRFDGSMASSRMIDKMLHLVVSNYQDYFYDVVPTLGRADLDVSSVSVDALLPSYDHTNSSGVTESGTVVTWENLYRPTDPDGFGTVTVVSLDVAPGGTFEAVGIVAEPGLVYSSRSALYLTDTEFDFFGTTRETTDIYKIAYEGAGATPVAVGTVPGRVLNQYSMSEHDGHLRVATTIGPTFSQFGQISESSNNVYVLAESEASLLPVGSVEGLAPGESIQAARFVGKRGYVVTFEEIDPLFTLDLSDPNNPRVIGELKVPGFSTYVVPMDENHLLAVGQYIPEQSIWGPRGVQLSIFDVSDFANPLLKHNTVLGDEGGASSEALWNPKAFTYYPESGVVALPVSIYNNSFFWEEDIDVIVADDVDGSSLGDGVDASPPDDDIVVDSDEPIEPTIPVEPIPVEPPFFENYDGLIVFDVSVESGFSERGRISTQFGDSYYLWSSFTRGVFIEEMVYAVTAHGIRALPTQNLGAEPLELIFEDTQPQILEPVEDGQQTSSEPVEG